MDPKRLNKSTDGWLLQASTSKTNLTPVPVRELNALDSALQELGMLSTLTDARLEYLPEMRAKRQVLNLVELNTRYVSNSTELRMKSWVRNNHRLKPYSIPVRSRGEERHRTRSENADVIDFTEVNLVTPVIDPVVNVATEEVQNMKKSKSLENVHLDNPMLPEVELVSTCIQKLKMVE